MTVSENPNKYSSAVLLQFFSHFWAVNFKNAGEKKGEEEKSISFFFFSFLWTFKSQALPF